MSFIFYLAVLLVAAASALFGLDLMTSPLPPDKPAQQVASTTAPTKLEQREADRKEEAAKQASTDDRALTPVFPAAPGGNKEVRMVYPPTNDTAAKPAETTGAAKAEDKPAPKATEQTAAVDPQPTSQQQAQPASVAPQPAAAPVVTAKAEPVPAKAEPVNTVPASAPAAAPAPQPVTQQSAGRCNVSACAAAYHSFRASDCTYQPFDGPRRVCEKPPQGDQQKTAERATPRTLDPRLERAAREARQSRKDAELSAVAQRVKELTSAGDDDYSLDPRPARGRRVIVIERGYGAGGYDDDD